MNLHFHRRPCTPDLPLLLLLLRGWQCPLAVMLPLLVPHMLVLLLLQHAPQGPSRLKHCHVISSRSSHPSFKPRPMCWPHLSKRSIQYVPSRK
jgi:hypothetical protein